MRLAAVDKHGEWGEHTPFPFGKHKGDPIGEVPDSYLRWWYQNNFDRGAIIVEMDFGPWSQRLAAVKKLRLHDYLKRKFNGTHLQQEGSETTDYQESNPASAETIAADSETVRQISFPD